MVPLRAPVAPGVKITLMVQVAFGATLPQTVGEEKSPGLLPVNVMLET